MLWSRETEADQFGQPVFPGSFPHTYAYDSSDRIITDTMTSGPYTWIKTYTYKTGTDLIETESIWLRQ